MTTIDKKVVQNIFQKMVRKNGHLDQTQVNQNVTRPPDDSGNTVPIHEPDNQVTNCANHNPGKSNGALLSTLTIMKHVISLAAIEAKYRALFLNVMQAIPLYNTLEEMGYNLPPTLI